MSTHKPSTARTTAVFLHTHPVFTVTEAVRGLGTAGNRSRALGRLRYHVKKGRVRSVAHEVYAAIPPGVSASRFEPDRYLVAAAVRDDAIFSHHAALELLGASHSEWGVCSVFTGTPRTPVALGRVRIEFLLHPHALRRQRAALLGTRTVERQGRVLRVTGPERTLVEGFRQPDRVGGLDELITAAAGFGVLDLPLFESVLQAYDEKRLWAAAGWFLERFQKRFFVPAAYLATFERHRPVTPRYVLRDRRGGRLSSRWNLIVPDEIFGTEPDDA